MKWWGATFLFLILKFVQSAPERACADANCLCAGSSPACGLGRKSIAVTVFARLLDVLRNNTCSVGTVEQQGKFTAPHPTSHETESGCTMYVLHVFYT